MPLSWSIKRYLLILVLAMAMPLAGLLFYSLHRNYLDVLHLAGLATTRITEMAAADTVRYLHDTRQFLAALAARPQVSRLDPGDCDPLLADIKGLFRQFANVAVVERQGQMVCSALRPNTSHLPSFAGADWFQEARRLNASHISALHFGPVSGKWVVVLSEPIRDDRGEFSGLVGYSLDLAGHQILGDSATALPPGMSLAVVDHTGRVLMRTANSTEIIGSPYSRPDIVEQLGDAAGYTLDNRNGEDLLFAYVPIKGSSWQVIGMRPAAPVIERVLSQANVQYVGAALLILLGSLFALFVARHIVGPMHRMADIARRIAQGDFEQRIEASGPKEIASVATHLNHMLDVRLKAEARFRNLLESASDAIVVVDQDARIVLTNERATQVFGYARDELLGMSIHALVPPDGQAAHAGQVAEYFANPRRRVPGRIVRGLRKDGRIFPCDIGLSPIQTEDGTMVSAIVRDLSERVELEERLAYQAQHDALTGLPNRSLLDDRLGRATARADRDGKCLAVIHIDIDRFGEINDFHGTVAADQVLKRCADRIRHALRDADSIVRSGSDEFIAIIEDEAVETAGQHFIQRVRDALAEPFPELGSGIAVTASFGIALYPCEGGASALLKHADLALIQAQRDGGDGLRFFESEMDARASRRMELLSRLRGAIGRGELFLHYQPQVETASGRLIGVEALLRWRNEDIGLVSPAQFIPLAEESGLIDSIGEWVLRRACEQGARWIAEGLPPLTIAVNLSARQLRQDRLLTLVKTVLAETGLSPGHLELEITEGMVMQDPDAAVATLHALHNAGPRIAIDDFGTGYSSLSYLQRFPVHALKVDQSFVRHVPDDADAVAIVTAVVSLAHGLRLSVVAEGVETEEQCRFLAALGCESCQGYFFSRPVPPDEIVRFALATADTHHVPAVLASTVPPQES